MSGCRISKFKMKKGGAVIHILDQPERTHFHTSIENASYSIDDNTHAFGFFVLSKDGDVTSGLSHGEYFTASQLKGACEHMKDSLMDQVWGADDEF